MRTDVNTFIGAYPFRDIGDASIGSLAEQLRVNGTSEAWVSNLPAVFWRDPASGNAGLVAACRASAGMRPVPAIHPGTPGWEAELDRAADAAAPCVRADAAFYGLAPAGPEMQRLAAACADRDVALMMAVRLEDIRQRHPNDAIPELAPSAVRTLIRSHPRFRLIVTHAEREFVEQVHFGATPDEAERILWDICWIWGPAEDHLELLLETVGAERFAFGSGAPLRIADNSAVKLELLDLDAATASLVNSGNAAAFAHR